MGFFKKLFPSYSEKELKKNNHYVDDVLALEDKYKAMDKKELKNQTNLFKERLEKGETLEDILPEAFATAREATRRVLKTPHYPSQVVGGVILHQGRISEMKTGEGKTQTVILPAYLNALKGEGVHIVTVNDYLAKRDSEWMGKVYRYLGLNVGVILNGITKEERRVAYDCDITYGTNNEFGFDYLRDNMVIYKKDKVQRGHVFAVVDEVDSILIDEARTPLIISGEGEESTDMYEQADKFVLTLTSIKIIEEDAKEDTDNLYEEDYIIYEKDAKTVITEHGVKKAEKYFNLENYTDPENSTIQHHINQALRAHGVMKADIDYIVEDGKIVIVDEFTGRLMQGRRYNKGLHQAIEAKEQIEIKKESKTLATITFQNYFRLYKKLSGMTGTAMTEEGEFREIYFLDCVEVPPNKTVIRNDKDDAIYSNAEGKDRAIVDIIKKCYDKKQPILVGTVSIEESEKYSRLIKHHGIPHEILNAKNHEREAEIVAQAGKSGAVTIATNMAGRGTDIILGGNAEILSTHEMRKQGYEEDIIVDATGFADTDNEEIIEARKIYMDLVEKFEEEIKLDKEKVVEAGGLFVLGTERHDSRRIDNQLRGRSGRQGDPGESVFILSLDDDLLRLFNYDRIQGMMESLESKYGDGEDMPIENKIITNLIESSQKRVEGNNFAARKRVLQYDDVLNKQREIIYGQRDQVLDNMDMHDNIIKMIEETAEEKVNLHMSGEIDSSLWNYEELEEFYKGWLLSPDESLEGKNSQQIKELIIERSNETLKQKEDDYGKDTLREVERVILLRNVDTEWMDHIDAMDELKQGMSLRSYGQQDPIVAYRIEGFDMFEGMISSIREATVRMILSVVIRTNEEPTRKQVAKETGTGKVLQRRVQKIDGKKVGRNAPCPCGSGKKYKNCHGRLG